ncbi:MAG: excisionase family DNA-binding protein [Planctomycetia bacterium]|nr:excisionase family DNA-binding protein [Planctomycetia bacterium]
MAKMFYSAEEAAAKLNLPADKIKELVEKNKLREFRDGNRVMFKVDQVDRLAGDMQGGTLDEGMIELAPLSGSGNPILNASDATAGGTAAGSMSGSLSGTKAGQSAIGKAPGKADTGLPLQSPKQPVKVFDESEVKPTDASAQTQISSPLDESISPSGLDSVGSGSGLLDLTRESDNTSLGAELLEEIYPGDHSVAGQSGVGSSSGVFDQPAAGGSAAGAPASSDSGIAVAAGAESKAATAPAATLSTPTYAPMYQAADASAGLFGGLALGASFVMVLTLVAAAAAFQGFVPTWVPFLAKNVLMFIAFLVVIAALLAGAGYLAGKAAD